jgi:hypothetical protein
MMICMMATMSYAQKMDIKGTVYDSTSVKTVHNAMVMAVRVRDSVLLGFTRSDIDGTFEIGGFEVDTFSLIIEHPNFDEKVYYIFGHSDNYEITIPSVVLPSKSQEIEEVVIYAYKDPIYYKGDTLVYVADSFQTHEGAVVEDLLKKLPGITVDKDGNITSQGQEIGKVLVDGDEFFGTDPTIATKNLGADGIEEVQVYEKDNDEGIGGDDEKIQVLDLKLKDDAKKGYFGRVSGASDFAMTPLDETQTMDNPFYEGELLFNKFSSTRKISVFALGSNTPRSNFGWNDMNKFGLDNETGGGNRWDGGQTSNTSGVPQTLKAGVYYSDKLGKKKQTKIGFNYSYYNDRLDATSASQSQYFLSDTTYFTDDSVRTYSKNESHRFNFNFETKLDSLTTFQVKPNVTFDKGLRDNSELSDYIGSNDTISLGTEFYNIDDSKGVSVGGFARINRKFMKKKRELELRYDISHSDNETDGTDSLISHYFPALFPDSVLRTDQKRINNNYNTNHYGTLTYVEPLSKKFKLNTEYMFQYGLSGQDKTTNFLDAATGLYDQRQEEFSNEFDNTKQQHRGGIALIYDYKKHKVSGGFRVRNINIDNVNITLDTTINQNITNFLPRFRYNWKPSMGKRFTVEYNTSSQAPSVNDIAPVPDNTNPNSIRVGNPDLQPNYVHSMNMRFHTFNAITGRVIWAGGNFTTTNNAFADSTIYDNFGRTESTRVNVDGNLFGMMYAGGMFPLWGRKIEIRPNLSGSYFRNTNYIESQENITDNYAITPNLDLDFNLKNDSIDIGLNGSYSINNAISSLNNVATPYSIQTYSADFTIRFPHGWTIGSEGTYTINEQSGGGFSTSDFDTKFFVLNAEISKKFLKTQNLQIALIGNDILNQNINANRQINGNIITDNRTTIISRYFLLKATLRFNNRRTKEEDGGMWH